MVRPPTACDRAGVMLRTKRLHGPVALLLAGVTLLPAVPAATAQEPTFGVGFSGVRLAKSRLTLDHGVVPIRLRCPVEAVGGCAGSTRLASRVRFLGRAAFTIPAGAERTVRVRVARTRLPRAARVRGLVTTTTHDDTGRSDVAIVAVTIRLDT